MGRAHTIETQISFTRCYDVTIIFKPTFSLLLLFIFAVQPTYQRYCHSTGEIEDYTEEDYAQGHSQHAYLYYKCRYETDDNSKQVATVIS